MTTFNQNLQIAQQQIRILNPMQDNFGNDVRRIEVFGSNDDLAKVAVKTEKFNSIEGGYTVYYLVLSCDLNNHANTATRESMAESKEWFDVCMAVCKENNHAIAEGN